MQRKLRGLKRRALELDFDLYRVRLPMPDQPGSELSVIDMRPEGYQTCLVFVHGYAGCAETWEHQITALARQHHVVAPDLRGHGQSDAPYSRYSMHELCRDLDAIAEGLELPERFVLVGHSFGGAIALEYAERRPERIERLILVATPGAFPLPRSVGMLSRVPTAVYRLFWRFRPRWNAEPHVLKRMLLGNMRRWQGWSILRGLRAETLLVTGARDTYFPRRVFDKVAEILPEAELVDVGASKHKVQLERHRAVTRAIARFVIADKVRSWRDEPLQAELAGRRPWLSSYDEAVPPTVPIPLQALPSFLESAARRSPQRPAIRMGDRSLKYRQLDARANQVARAMQGLGLSQGERVTLAARDHVEWPAAFFGILKAGGVVVLPDSGRAASRLARQHRSTGARFMITDRLCSQRLGSRVAVDSQILVDLHDRELEKLQGPIALEALLVDVEEQPLAQRLDPEALAVIAYTDGATGEPKAAGLSHANLVANAVQLRHWIPQLAYGRETIVSMAALGQPFGMLMGLSLPVLLGATVVLPGSSEPHAVLQAIKRFRPGVLVGLPAAFRALIEEPAPRRFGIESIDFCISAGGPMAVEQIESFEKLTRGRLIEVYGLCEAGPVTHANPSGADQRPGSIGLPLPNTDAKVFDEQSRSDCALGEVGELIVSGPQVMRGYWCAETQEASAQALEGSETQLIDGWLHTGDLAVMNAEGYFRVLGRKSDRILSSAGVVYPRDIEEVLHELADLRELAVLGDAAPPGRQSAHAIVVPVEAARVDTRRLREHCERRLPQAAWPQSFIVCDRLPRLASGRLDRSALRDMLPSPEPDAPHELGSSASG